MSAVTRKGVAHLAVRCAALTLISLRLHIEVLFWEVRAVQSVRHERLVSHRNRPHGYTSCSPAEGQTARRSEGRALNLVAQR